MNEPMTVRFATEEDAPVVYRFIRKMAEYEKLEHEVDTSEEAFRTSLIAHCLFALSFIAR